MSRRILSKEDNFTIIRWEDECKNRDDSTLNSDEGEIDHVTEILDYESSDHRITDEFSHIQ